MLYILSRYVVQYLPSSHTLFSKHHQDLSIMIYTDENVNGVVS